MSILEFLWDYLWVVLLLTLAVSLYGIIARPNMLKKIISLTILGDVVNVMVVFIGYRLTYPVVPPILPSLSKESLSQFVNTAVDPLPQALVITAVVIGMAVNMLLAVLTIQLYRLYGTLDVREIAKRGGEE
ncbi:Na+/H+ antiporter subunit C [Thermococcus sp. M39]|uniref:sodium:proton antiporter n=1 Tax=unclassified Thermococcus TaxID=2627626 RepID=UPI00143B10EF|nr:MULTISPECIES: sodium:proton antiporter [unclassified Thermococcus]NJE07104.1 Na+/H+ antiporter subunit C [Thermococcus sp. M39]NJE13714.1 Na+/H+ antiporter subunit C [Thermococcus sp. LS2]